MMQSSETTAATTTPPRFENERRFARRLRFGRRARTGLIGVEIGERALRVAQLEATGSGFRILAADALGQAFQPVAGDADRSRANGTHGDVEPPGLRGVGKAIRRIVRAGEFAGNRVACLLPPLAYQSDVVPPIDGDGRTAAESIHRRFARRIASTAPSELVFNHWRTSGAEGNSNDESPVQVVAVARRTVEELGAELLSAGFQVHCVDAPITAAARAVRLFGSSHIPGISDNPRDVPPPRTEARRRTHPGPPHPADALVIDWQQTTTSLTLVGRGVGAFSRSFGSSGFQTVIDAVARGFELAPRHAAVLLRDYGLPGPGQTTPQARIATTIFGLVREPLRRFREEIERTLSYFRRKSDCGQPVRVFLTGDGGRIPHLPAWLSDELRIPCDAWSLPTRTSREFPNPPATWSESQTSLPAEFCLAAALSAIPFDGAGP